jgi:hypothetical protein
MPSWPHIYDSRHISAYVSANQHPPIWILSGKQSEYAHARARAEVQVVTHRVPTPASHSRPSRIGYCLAIHLSSHLCHGKRIE